MVFGYVEGGVRLAVYGCQLTVKEKECVPARHLLGRDTWG